MMTVFVVPVFRRGSRQSMVSDHRLLIRQWLQTRSIHRASFCASFSSQHAAGEQATTWFLVLTGAASYCVCSLIFTRTSGRDGGRTLNHSSV
jgi:hypothetical protein